jgi:hypothetical protein
MTEKTKTLLSDWNLDDAVVFENPSYETAIVGYDVHSNRIIYDYELMIDYLVENEQMNEDEAVEFIDYNTIRSLDYVENHPIILNRIF